MIVPPCTNKIAFFDNHPSIALLITENEQVRGRLFAKQPILAGSKKSTSSQKKKHKNVFPLDETQHT